MDEAQLKIRRTDVEVMELVAAGAWIAAGAEALDQAVDAVIASRTGPRVTIDATSVCHLDTYGAWQMERIARAARARGAEVTVTGLAHRFTGLLDAVRKVPESVPVRPPSWTPLRALEALGRRSAGVGEDLHGMVNLLGAAGHALARSAAEPRSFRLTSMVHQLDRVAWAAVPIVLLITFLIGGIIAQQGFFHFRKFGADQYVVDMVGILVLREIGVLLVAIMVAGRSGSSYTAELGSMKMREEIDALRTMGLDPVSVLILPRLLALIIALPVLAFLGSVSALFGGGIVAWIYGDMHPAIFVERLREAISLTHLKVGLIKAPFMALVIGIVACSEGFKVRGSAESLGLQTTASVVKSIFLVILLDGIFAMYFSAIGM